MALKIKLVRSIAGASKDQLATVRGLGLTKFGQERLIQDSPSNRGQVFKVKHMVSQEVVAGEAPKRERQKPRKDKVRRAARAKETGA